MVAWLVAVLVVGVAGLVHPVSSWLMVHLLLLGAVSNAILIWSRHFADALLRLADAPGRRAEAIRLGVFNAGTVGVVAGMVTDRWGLVLVGAATVAAVVAWHGAVLLARMRRALPSRFTSTIRYYVAAAALLLLGVALGAVMAQGTLSDEAHAQVALAHASLNLLGWMGLTVVGTLVTLWPTMLHTLVADGAERAARRALPVLVLALTVAAVGALLGTRVVAGIGLLCYLAGLVVAGRPLVAEARARPPRTYATRSLAAGLTWYAGSCTALAAIVLLAPGWVEAAEAADRLAGPFLVGFVAQVLLGALSYLVPVVLGGGPARTRATNATLDLGGTTRLTVINLALVVATTTLPGPAGMVSLSLAVLGLAAFLPLVVRAAVIARRA